jgi:hemerythrin-like domain-containing protein
MKTAIDALTSPRRQFLKTGALAATGLLAGSALPLVSGCHKEDEEDVTPTEDLMREHGILNRVLIAYDHFVSMLQVGQAVNPQWLGDAANIIHVFIEQYHEKQEEDFLFPRFEKAGKLAELVATLRTQHQKGRDITGQLLNIAKQPALSGDGDKATLMQLLTSFNKMYRPHEAREDTILFPALRSIVSAHEFASLGEQFEDNERKQFGQDGFELYVEKIGALEKQMGIYDLNQFTPG